MFNKEKCYPEDYHLENGNYSNICKQCEQEFLGHKHRRICKQCNHGHNSNNNTGTSNN